MARCDSALAATRTPAVLCLTLSLLLAGCASSTGEGRSSFSSLHTNTLHAKWVNTPPDGCAVGVSGPTLNPRNAIRNARFSAIETLAADSLSVDVQSMTGVGPYGSFEVSAQALSGSLADARIVSLWSESGPETAATRSLTRERSRRGPRRLKWVYALACWPSAVAREVPRPAYPVWLIDPVLTAATEGTSESSSLSGIARERICATGIAGPTWRPADQPASALRDAQRALAVALESRIEKRIFDDGHGVARILREVEPSSAALARAGEATALSQEWYDERGDGPIGLPDVLYGLACIGG